MKKLLLLSLLFLPTLLMAKTSTPDIARIDPANWYVGLRNTSLQLMVYGKGIREAEVTTDYAGARIDSLVRLDSPNYLLVYLSLDGAKAGTMPLTFKVGRKQKTVNYELRQREKAGEERVGFSNADVLYMLMPDRFAQAGPVYKDDPRHPLNTYVVDREAHSLRHGGNLEGIRQHLDYFVELGVTALWFTPVLENNSPDRNGYSTYHGYATTDYYRVDPRFGTNAQYRQLIDEAHARGLKVVMDMIFNHCGYEHPWIADLPSHDWLNGIAGTDVTSLSNVEQNVGMTSYKLTPVLDPYASDVDRRETVDGWFVPTMPDLNHRNQHVMTYLIQNSIWWIETAGIDGIRMDTYPYADATGMARWMRVLGEEYPRFNVVGETWVTEPAYTAAWQKDSRLTANNSYLPTVMDFAFFDRLAQAKNEETDAWWQGMNRLYNSFVYDYLYEDPTHVMAFVDNHDTDRFLGEGQDAAPLRQALALLLTVRRIPQLYYGTEILMNGTKAVSDGYVRKDFPGGFPGDRRNAFTAAGRTKAEQQMFQWLSRLLHWRQGNAAIISGSMKQFIPVAGVYVIARRHEGRTVLTIINGTSKVATFSAARYAELWGQTMPASIPAVDVPTGQAYDVARDFELEPRAALVLDVAM